MPDAVTHPTPQELAAFGRGMLPERAAAAVAAHLQSCPACCQAADGVLPTSFLGQAGPAGPAGSSSASGWTQLGSVPSSASPPALPGDAGSGIPPELADHPDYKVLRELGRGGMGVVYLARNRVMDRLEVLKVINPALVDRLEARERFLQEIRAAARLNHENVVRALSVPRAGNLLVLAMEYVEGENLAKVVRERLAAARGPLPVAHACYYVYQVALALQHAYERGMVHRDIKPQNLILTRDGKSCVVRILDFGLAKATSEKRLDHELTGTGMMLGTPEYMAPEQSWDAATADIRADIYSLGCTLYCLLSGAPPFKAKSLYQLLQAHDKVEARQLNLLRPDVPVALAAVVAKMMAKKPAERYQTPAEVAQALLPFFQAPGTAEVGSPCRLIDEAPRKASTPPPAGDAVGASADAVPSAKPMVRSRVLSARAAPWAESVPDIDPALSRTAIQLPRNLKQPARPSAHRVWLRLTVWCALLLAGAVALWASCAFMFKAIREAANGDATRRTSAVAPLAKEEQRNAPAPKEIINSIGMKLVLIPAGKFLMGSPPNERGRHEDEWLQHEVEITRPFYMGVYEVTQEEYQTIMDTNPSWFSAQGDGKGRVAGQDTHRFPIENITWDQAVEFCRRLSTRPYERSAERTYRLPTEAEWEYACRGGARFSEPFHFGKTLSGAQANINASNLGRTTSVGSYPANAFGLHDMHGNVWEWCQDFYDKDYYARSPQKDPENKQDSGRRVVRSGSWYTGVPMHARSADRGAFEPGRRDYNTGFRVVLPLRELPATKTELPNGEPTQSAKTDDKNLLRPGMVFEGTKTWTRIGAVVPPGTVRRVRLTITEVDGTNFKAVYSAGNNEPTTWSWKATGEYGCGKIKWAAENDGGTAEGRFEGELIEFDAGSGVGSMRLIVRPSAAVTIRKGMYWEGIKTWTRGVFPPGTRQEISLEITQVNDNEFHGILRWSGGQRLVKGTVNGAMIEWNRDGAPSQQLKEHYKAKIEGKEMTGDCGNGTFELFLTRK